MAGRFLLAYEVFPSQDYHNGHRADGHPNGPGFVGPFHRVHIASNMAATCGTKAVGN